ncbi:hypothetical protein BC332_34143 [Capsicum chinense]|nr:hypothetical protein BC332_34143 [Capsicum chinense]
MVSSLPLNVHISVASSLPLNELTQKQRINLMTAGYGAKSVHSIATESKQVKKIEELVYRIEDVLQTYGVLARSKRFGMLLCLNSVSRRHGAAARKQAMSKITRLCDNINKHVEIALRLHEVQGPSDLHFESSSWYDNNQQLLQNVVCSPVGLEEEKELIVQELLAERPVRKLLAIPIWEHSGTGKTTPAGVICSDSRITEEFKVHHVKIPISDCSVDDNYVLEESISKQLKELIVLDDVRSINDWFELRSAL